MNNKYPKTLIGKHLHCEAFFQPGANQNYELNFVLMKIDLLVFYSCDGLFFKYYSYQLTIEDISNYFSLVMKLHF